MIRSYGVHPSQFVEIWPDTRRPETARPDAGLSTPEGSSGTVVLIHGGYWRARYGCDLMHPMAERLASLGLTVVNVEYRRIGEVDDPWPAMSADLLDAWALAVELAGEGPLSVVGHSAGGHLAAWLAAATADHERGRVPDLVVALAPVADLREADRRSLSEGAVRELLGGSAADRPERYAEASPSERLPLGVPLVVVHGDADTHVPPDLADAFVEAARSAGDDVEILRPIDVDHFDIIDPTTAIWADVEERLIRRRSTS